MYYWTICSQFAVLLSYFFKYYLLKINNQQKLDIFLPIKVLLHYDCKRIKRGLKLFIFTVLRKFLTLFLVAYTRSGTLPISRSTLILDVCVRTPKSCFIRFMWIWSMKFRLESDSLGLSIWSISQKSIE